MATFERVRLTQLNIKKYLYEKFGYDADIKLMGEKRLKDVPILLQDDYGEDNDCSLVSILTILNYKFGNLDLNH